MDNALVSCQQPHSGPPQMASINEKAAMTGLAVQPAARASEQRAGLGMAEGARYHAAADEDTRAQEGAVGREH